MPILKSGSKRRSRVDLTVEMISAPLADFRHTMHIGRGGDTFGDTSFLSTKAAPANQVAAPMNGSMMRRLRGSKHSLTESSASDSAGHPLQANGAVSLLHVNDDHDLGLHLPRSSSSSFSDVNGLDGQSLNMEREEQGFDEERKRSESPAPPNGGMTNAGSNLSLNIDLGPSMLGDILSVMDQNGQGQPTKGDSEWSLDVFRPLSSGASASQVTAVPNTTYTTTHCATPNTMYNTTQSMAVPNTTQRATYNTTQITIVPNTTQRTRPNTAQIPPLPNTTHRATPNTTYNTQITPLPNNTQRATYNTTQSPAVPNTTHRATPNTTYNTTQITPLPNNTQRTRPNTTQSTAVPNTTHSATHKTTYTTQSMAVPNTTHSATHKTTADGKYCGVFKATPTMTYSSVHDPTPAATHPRTTPNTTHSASISHDDILFMDEDEDDEEIRV